MKLKECLELGKVCGLTTWEECYDNVYLHAGSIFKYDEIGNLIKLAENIMEALY